MVDDCAPLLLLLLLICFYIYRHIYRYIYIGIYEAQETPTLSMYTRFILKVNIYIYSLLLVSWLRLRHATGCWLLMMLLTRGARSIYNESCTMVGAERERTSLVWFFLFFFLCEFEQGMDGHKEKTRTESLVIRLLLHPMLWYIIWFTVIFIIRFYFRSFIWMIWTIWAILKLLYSWFEYCMDKNLQQFVVCFFFV